MRWLSHTILDLEQTHGAMSPAPLPAASGFAWRCFGVFCRRARREGLAAFLSREGNFLTLSDALGSAGYVFAEGSAILSSKCTAEGS